VKHVIRVSQSYSIGQVMHACAVYEAILAGKGVAELQKMVREDLGFFSKLLLMRGRGRAALAKSLDIEVSREVQEG
jgi:hypothetical protein